MNRPLLAGSFTKPPVAIQHMRAGRIMLVGDDNQSCWSDREGRFLLDSMEEVVTLLTAHRYVLIEGKEVVPMVLTPQPEPESAPKVRKPRKKIEK